jgi:hypothetical protein
MYGSTLPIPGISAPSTEPGRKEAIAMAKKKPITSDDFYLGPIPFKTQFPAPVIGVSKWLVDYWPKKRVELRRAMLAELTPRPKVTN